MEEIVNRVSKSPLVAIDLDEYMNTSEKAVFNMKEALFDGIILREKHFREFIRDHNWSQYSQKNVLVTCSEDTIIPSWAYMIVCSKLEPFANILAVGDNVALEKKIVDSAIQRISELKLESAKVVIKGCGGLESRDYAYFELTKALLPRVSSIMYGEPCSTVPVYKKKSV